MSTMSNQDFFNLLTDSEVGEIFYNETFGSPFTIEYERVVRLADQGLMTQTIKDDFVNEMYNVGALDSDPDAPTARRDYLLAIVVDAPLTICTTPTRTVNSAFQPQPSGEHKVMECSYAMKLNVQSLVLGTAEVKVELFMGPTSTPTILADKCSLKVAGVLGITNEQIMSLKVKCPEDWYLKIVPTVVSGTATGVYDSGFEQVSN